MLKIKGLDVKMELPYVYLEGPYGAEEDAISDPIGHDGFGWDEPLVGTEVIAINGDAPWKQEECLQLAHFVDFGKRQAMLCDEEAAFSKKGGSLELQDANQLVESLIDDKSLENLVDLDQHYVTEYLKEIEGLDDGGKDLTSCSASPTSLLASAASPDSGFDARSDGHEYERFEAPMGMGDSFETIDLSALGMGQAPAIGRSLETPAAEVQLDAETLISIPDSAAAPPILEHPRVDLFHAYAQRPTEAKSAEGRRRGGKRSRAVAPEVKKLKKKEQNKTAAQRYRMKKKQETGSIFEEEKIEAEKNKELKRKVEGLESEIRYLKDFKEEIERKRRC